MLDYRIPVIVNLEEYSLTVTLTLTATLTLAVTPTLTVAHILTVVPTVTVTTPVILEEYRGPVPRTPVILE